MDPQHRELLMRVIDDHVKIWQVLWRHLILAHGYDGEEMMNDSFSSLVSLHDNLDIALLMEGKCHPYKDGNKV
jgi:hypothetical protein